MTADTPTQQASARAQVYAPKPTGGCIMAGGSVGVIAFGLSYGVLSFYSYDFAEFRGVVGDIVLAAAATTFGV